MATVKSLKADVLSVNPSSERMMATEIHPVASCYRNWNKLPLDGKLGSSADLTF